MFEICDIYPHFITPKKKITKKKYIYIRNKKFRHLYYMMLETAT